MNKFVIIGLIVVAAIAAFFLRGCLTSDENIVTLKSCGELNETLESPQSKTKYVFTGNCAQNEFMPKQIDVDNVIIVGNGAVLESTTPSPTPNGFVITGKGVLISGFTMKGFTAPILLDDDAQAILFDMKLEASKGAAVALIRNIPEIMAAAPNRDLSYKAALPQTFAMIKQPATGSMKNFGNADVQARTNTSACGQENQTSQSTCIEFGAFINSAPVWETFTQDDHLGTLTFCDGNGAPGTDGPAIIIDGGTLTISANLIVDGNYVENSSGIHIMEGTVIVSRGETSLINNQKIGLGVGEGTVILCDDTTLHTEDNAGLGICVDTDSSSTPLEVFGTVTLGGDDLAMDCRALRCYPDEIEDVDDICESYSLENS